MRQLIEEWQELSIAKRKYRVNRMRRGIGIMEENKEDDTFMFKLVSYTPGINKFGDIDDASYKVNEEQYRIFKADLR